MFDFRLKVFYAVAKRMNFTKAANELFITQPAVTKHIHELETHFKLSLFERSGNKRITLTPAGETLLGYAEQLFGIYNELDFDMNVLAKQHGGILRLGASNTAGQYLIPSILAQFHKRFKDIKVSMINGNTEQIEDALLKKEIDLGVIEGVNRNASISYHDFTADELVLVCSSTNKLVKKDTLKTEELKNYPFVFREHGSGSLDVIVRALKDHNLRLTDLRIEMQLGGAESIKSYLANSDCLAFLSIHSIFKELKSGEFRIVDIKGFEIDRKFYFIHAHGQPSSLAESFIRFSRNYQPG